jgi:hypothetical protein
VTFFPDDVRRFIDGWIDSVDQLEILRLLADHPETAWDASAVARELPAAAAPAAALGVLHDRGLLTAERRGAAVVYRHDPDAAVADQLSRVLHFYHERPVSVIRAVYTRSKHSSG